MEDQRWTRMSERDRQLGRLDLAQRVLRTAEDYSGRMGLPGVEEDLAQLRLELYRITSDLAAVGTTLRTRPRRGATRSAPKA